MLKKRFQRGSLLLEIGFTLVVIGVMAGLATSSLNGLEQARQASKREIEIRLANQALKAFIQKAGRLPCPDLTGSGWEGDAAGQCPAGVQVGRFPYVSLNMGMPDASLFLRYGVWRASGIADYVLPVDPATGVTSAEAFVAVARFAATGAAGGGQPYVAGVNPDGRSVNCGSAAVTPAYALMFVSPETLMGGNPLCFFETSTSFRDLAFVTHNEILGWTAAQSRH